ncbi:Purine efflux pump PbuE [compost metagenome]
MDVRVYFLAVASFVVGTVELIIGGNLDLIASDLNVSISMAGQLISVFSIAFAISAPLLFTITSKLERKSLFLGSLLLFLAGNVLAALSPSYSVLFLARIVSAASGSLVVVLAITIASQIVQKEYRARAIGLIYMGISGSLVLGVPIGMVLGNAYGWRAPFVLISVLTLVSMVFIYYQMPGIPAAEFVPLRSQLGTLKNRKIISAQLTSMLFLTGHLTLYAYLTPFLQTLLHLSSTVITVVYFLFGIAAVLGGGIGGWVVDKWGATKSILVIISAFLIAILLMPAVTSSFYVFLAVMMLWSMLSWAITPAQQDYLISIAPESSGIQQSLNNSAMHFGIAIGSSIGGLVIEEYSVEYNAWVGGVFVVIALLCAIYSITRPRLKNTANSGV